MTTEIKGIEKLRAAVDRDLKNNNMHDYEAKFDWVVERAKLYAEVFDCEYTEVIEVWEEHRNYWYMNFYQNANQPIPTQKNVFVYDNPDEALKVFGESGYRCPSCKSISTHLQDCTQDDCDWKAYGFLKTLGTGAHIALKDSMGIIEIFMPIALEK